MPEPPAVPISSDTSSADADSSLASPAFGYASSGCFDETFADDGRPREQCRVPVERLAAIPVDTLKTQQDASGQLMRQMGITFNVYGDEGATERILPFDVLPRMVRGDEWKTIERGLIQRSDALNKFLHDIYNDQKILADGVVPRELVESSPPYLKQCHQQQPPREIWCHITGTDLVRDADGTVYVLEDNLRVPSGVSYVLENREVMKRTLPEVFAGCQIASVENYPERLLQTLIWSAPEGVTNPQIVVLTPGIYNSAYFEHSYLAQEMGVELVEGGDLLVENDRVYMQTTGGLEQVHVIYRRIDDTFLDPEAFNPDSMLGVPGLMRAYRAGNVTLANAPGNGVADDKAIYAYVPEIIRYYLQEDIIVPNVPTFVCDRPAERDHVLKNLDSLVVKPTNESGGYGILIGPHSTAEQRDKTADAVRADPRNWIAQEMLTLSTCPTLIDGRVVPRHVDLRPFILRGESTYVLPGGLTRVAMKEGSTVVNSSQGGGSKDTWVLAADSEVNVRAAEAGLSPMAAPGKPVR